MPGAGGFEDFLVFDDAGLGVRGGTTVSSRRKLKALMATAPAKGRANLRLLMPADLKAMSSWVLASFVRV